MRFPRFKRTEVGNSNLISFANADNRAEGSREVVTDVGQCVVKLGCGRSRSPGLTQDTRIYHSRELCVFVIEVQLLVGAQVGSAFVILIIFAQGFVVGDGRIQRLSRGQ